MSVLGRELRKAPRIKAAKDEVRMARFCRVTNGMWMEWAGVFIGDARF